MSLMHDASTRSEWIFVACVSERHRNSCKPVKLRIVNVLCGCDNLRRIIDSSRICVFSGLSTIIGNNKHYSVPCKAAKRTLITSSHYVHLSCNGVPHGVPK